MRSKELMLVLVIFVLFPIFAIDAQELKIPPYFYKRFEGTIVTPNKKLRIIMNLKKDSLNIGGTYYYENIGRLFALRGTIKTDGSFRMFEYLKDEETGIFDGQFTNEKELAGTWHKSNATYDYEFKLTENYPGGTAQFEIKHFYKENIFKQGGAAVSLTFPVMINYENAGRQKRINRAINDNQNPEEVVSNNLNSMVNEIKEIYDENNPELSSWYFDEDIAVLFNSNYVLAIASYVAEYSGGAHPNFSIIYTNFNLRNGEKITLDDIFIQNYQERLDRIGEEIFGKAQNIGPNQTYEDAGFWFDDDKFALPDNFLLTKAGLEFLYNPYEITSYAEGTIELFIPYSKIKDLIKKGSIVEELAK